jgi:N-acetylglucosamine-6-phosphate deacetylase
MEVDNLLPRSGFVDLQVNGYAGVDFNGPLLSADSLHTVCLRLQSDGVVSFLPTLITDSVSTMSQRAKHLLRLRDMDPLAKAMIPGLHLEGPFISPLAGYVGAHPPAHAQPATVDQAKRLFDAADGQVKIVTLAPEQDPQGIVTQWLARQQVIVAAGHTDATLAELRRAIDAGLVMFTHLGNGCPSQLPRHDNIIQRVLSLADQLWISFICDGHHVPAFALGNYLKLANPEKTIVVTDAISAAGLGPGIYQLSGMDVEVTEDGAAWAPGRKHFAGAAVTMIRSCEVLRDQLGLTTDLLQRFTGTNPRKLLGSVNR